MPATSIQFAPGFNSLTKVTNNLYIQAFVGQGVHASYATFLQQELALAWSWAGMPVLHSQITANQYIFLIADIRYVVYQNGVVVQFALTYAPAPAAPQNKSMGTVAESALPTLDAAGGPSEPFVAE